MCGGWTGQRAAFMGHVNITGQIEEADTCAVALSVGKV